MSSTKSPFQVNTKPYAYEDFQGLDSTRDITSLESGRKQHLSGLNNGFCDWRGQIVRDPGASYYKGTSLVTHLSFYSRTGIVWAERDGAGTNLCSDTGQKVSPYARSSVVCSTVFNRRAIFFSAAQQCWVWDGTNFKVNSSAGLDGLRPGFGVSVSRRLAVSGIPGRETEVHISRVDDHQIFPDDEAKDATSVLRAGKIDVANYIGAAEEITGLARFEQNKLAIFTSDRCIIYAIDPSISAWTLDERANINVGCISHNTIAMAGEDVLFCSRSGVHALSRSTDNGITITSTSLADKIDILYRQLIASCPDVSSIEAVFDQDMGQYHIYIPQAGGVICKRLTVTIKPGMMDPKWSTSEFLNARCGAFQGGQLYVGTPGGVYKVGKIEDTDDETYPSIQITTPYLWHGSFHDTKNIHSIIIQAAGNGTATLEIFNDRNQLIASDTFEVDASPDDNNFPDVPLSRQYERKCEHRYRGAQFRLTIPGTGLLRIAGFAVVVKKE